MAAIVNYRDKLIQGGSAYTASPRYGIEFWEDLGSSSTPSRKPSDNATVGAVVDGNLDGLIDTHNLQLNAATEHSYAESYIYNAGTETQEVDFDVTTEFGNVLLFISYYFIGNHSATIGHSTVVIEIFFNGVSILNVLTTQILNEAAPSGTTLLMANQLIHHPELDENNSIIITDENDAHLLTDSGQLILDQDAGSTPQNYKITATYDATGDGVRGVILNLVVSAIILKR